MSSTLYPKLAILMGNVPNYQGVFLRGYGSQTQVDKIYGNVIHSSAALNILQGDTIRNIWGTIVGSGSVEEYATYTGAFYRIGSGAGAGAGWSDDTFGFDASHVVPTAVENRPINMAVRYLIKAK